MIQKMNKMNLNLLGVLFLPLVVSYDAILWSSDASNLEKDIKTLVDSANPRQKVYLIGVEDFNLDNLDKDTDESSVLHSIVSKKHEEISNFNGVSIPQNNPNVEYIEVMLETLDSIKKFENDFVAILSEPEAFKVNSRVKRVGLIDDNEGEEEEEEDPRPRSRQNSKSKSKSRFRSSGGASLNFPVILPPYDSKAASPKKPDSEWGSCLLYLESIGLYVFDATRKKDLLGIGAFMDSRSGNKFSFGDGNVKCDDENGEYEFTIEATPAKPLNAYRSGMKEKSSFFSINQPISFTLKIKNLKNEWRLVDVVINDDIQIKKGQQEWLNTSLSVKPQSASPASVLSLGVTGYNGYNYACSATNAAVFRTNKKNFDFGLVLGNVQIQTTGVLKDQKAKFAMLTNDCVPTFSAGSWMGIIVAVLLISILTFGFLMLNSVKTIDRFDDPKRKQMVVNVKE
ncbi:unnamed protein product [Bursaphelenchus okinawaensis]|uniref:V-type proton ATPase subunit S1/VOA1 transmembrane domain-containing protein n=1 Tax=Bursaphelenchus okinawaensis TaxID=465554 RepID=A0A811KN77_9BILA|nr:unnamed protein product [Bursaphelenchus okinawaensis]CAG9106550.1 unnamed protein product [Bursaphelenchus okinawaensis]